ncbi:MerR family transcriptional regulator [Roseibium denhamense]|uniref:DNA-binding transcriptional regulator, MerR family n=1 Tax=Roseibium denhamense TaxID=76305 RepID=A0ABY1P4Z9_9HYPH|nr:MerR family transcriptional regulator [Roseibium denhamense]MTI07218.1 MerR family transcriptional regulator [Roseibium denhamense]SMP26528.1 DNA-binding transcriptional regulator, MerR family [Roseibium denhamense]
MDKKLPDESLLTAAECGARTGLSIKTLRLYETHGLVAPKRTEKNWRLYDTDDIVRLNEVMFLKRLGLSLSRIAELLSGQRTDLGRLLELQAEVLREQSAQVENSLQLITRLQAKAQDGRGLSMEDLLKLAKETQMSETRDEIAWKRYEQARPRTEIDPPVSSYPDYVGDYQFDDGIAATIRIQDGVLIAEVLGQPALELFPEAPDQFFLKVVPAQITFQRDEHGDVQYAVLHQGGYDLKAKRCEPGTFERCRKNMKARVEACEAQPESEQRLLKVINDHVNGTIDYADYSPILGSLVREQSVMVRKELQRLGPLHSMTFRGVGSDGFDLFVVDFRDGRLEWGLSHGTDGRINGLYLRPAPCDVV